LEKIIRNTIYFYNSDLIFAKMAGFDPPILQGLCSFGFAGRAIVHNPWGSEPARLQSLGARFMNVVYPGGRAYYRGLEERAGGALHNPHNQAGRKSNFGQCRGGNCLTKEKQ
jgi:hypothetical protein